MITYNIHYTYILCVGVEYEFLKRYDQSIINYRKGVEIAEHYLGMFICV